jgi:putative hydrolase of HD superfamily
LGQNGEFSNRYRENREIKEVDVIDKNYDKDIYDPLDGKMVKCCDVVAAYTEAALSIHYGIDSGELREGLKNSRNAADQNVSFNELYDDIDNMFEIKR